MIEKALKMNVVMILTTGDQVFLRMVDDRIHEGCYYKSLKNGWEEVLDKEWIAKMESDLKAYTAKALN